MNRVPMNLMRLRRRKLWLCSMEVNQPSQVHKISWNKKKAVLFRTKITK